MQDLGRRDRSRCRRSSSAASSRRRRREGPARRLRTAAQGRGHRVGVPGPGRGPRRRRVGAVAADVARGARRQLALGGARLPGVGERDRSGLASAYLVSSGADPNTVVVAADRLQTPGFRALAWSFVFMELIGVVTAVVALIGLVLYLQARQRSRELLVRAGPADGPDAGAHRRRCARDRGAAGVGVRAGEPAGARHRGADLPAAGSAAAAPPPPMLRMPFSLLAWIGARDRDLRGGRRHGGSSYRAERANVGAVLRFDE